MWDKHSNAIVNNESSEIIRILNTEFNAFATQNVDFYPDDLKDDIDNINAYVYENINNGVYRCGFATTQDAYESAYHKLFDGLDTIENKLNANKFLLGDTLTEADIRLFTTLIRFDQVYVLHFKCNKKRIIDYPNLAAYVKTILNYQSISDTVFMEEIKSHYFQSHPMINPYGIVPLGPETN